MIVRPACPDDVDTVVRFRMRLVDSYGVGIRSEEHPQFPAQIRARLLDLLDSDTHRFLIAEHDGEARGCICGSLELSLPGPTWPGVCGVVTDMWVDERAPGPRRCPRPGRGHLPMGA